VAERLLIEVFQVSLDVPQGLPAAEDNAVRLTLDDPQFHAELRRFPRRVVRRHPSLSKVKVTVTQ
jgi:hypothetical protein